MAPNGTAPPTSPTPAANVARTARALARLLDAHQHLPIWHAIHVGTKTLTVCLPDPGGVEPWAEALDGVVSVRPHTFGGTVHSTDGLFAGGAITVNVFSLVDADADDLATETVVP